MFCNFNSSGVMRIYQLVSGRVVDIFIIYVELSSFVLLYNTTFMNKIKFNDKKNLK